LGDSSKRSIFDQTGADPGSRSSGGAGASSGFDASTHPFFQGGDPFGFAGQQGGFSFNDFQGSGMGGGPDIFDILFGGQGGRMGGSTFTFGGPGGVRFTTSGGGPFGQAHQQQRRRQQQQQQQRQQQPAQPQTLLDTMMQYLPVILVLIIPILSNFLSETPEKFELRSTPPFTSQQISKNYKIPFYITPKQAESLPADKLSKLAREAERAYIGNLQESCRRETNIKEHHIQNSYGWVFTDQEKLEKAQQMRLPSCEKLAQIGVNLL
jgi:DnaJ family protein B protein 12